LARSLHTAIIPSSKNCASSIPTTSQLSASKRIFAAAGTGVERISLASCDTTFSSSYRMSTAGLKISTFCFANWALFSLRISSSVLSRKRIYTRFCKGGTNLLKNQRLYNDI